MTVVGDWCEILAEIQLTGQCHCQAMQCLQRGRGELEVDSVLWADSQPVHFTQIGCDVRESCVYSSLKRKVFVEHVIVLRLE